MEAEAKEGLAARTGSEEELELAYMSIETMKNRITQLEAEIARLTAESNTPHPASDGWSGDMSGGYNQGFRGHGY